MDEGVGMKCEIFATEANAHQRESTMGKTLP